MRFTSTRLRKLGQSNRAIQQLRSRQRGGVSGASGYEYQRRFAILRVLELAAAGENGTVIMEALCPVDDVVVEHPGLHEHSQLKESPTETWGKDKKKLKREFSAQRSLMKRAKAGPFRLQLVTPHAHRAKLLSKATPPSLKLVVDVRHFPRPRIPQQAWVVPDVAKALGQLLIPDPLSGRSQREQLWAAVNHACGNPWGTVLARDVVRRAGRAQLDLPLRDARRRPAIAQRHVTDALTIANAIPQLDVRIVDGICFSVFAGVERRLIGRVDTEAFARFIERILQRLPSTYDAFYEELP